MNTKGDHLLELEILGQAYQVRVHGTEEWAKHVGAMVDETMRTIQHETHLVDTTKIAILAALNLADRLLSQKEMQKNMIDVLKETTQEVNLVLSEAMK